MCVASFYIASFSTLPLPHLASELRQWEDEKGARRREIRRNEREAMSIMKYILLKWRWERRKKHCVDGKYENTKRKGLPLINSSSCLAWKAPECGKFRKFSFTSLLVRSRRIFCRRKCLSVFSGETEIYRTTLQGISIFGAKEGEQRKSYAALRRWKIKKNYEACSHPLYY